jgi:hypothetical protein
VFRKLAENSPPLTAPAAHVCASGGCACRALWLRGRSCQIVQQSDTNGVIDELGRRDRARHLADLSRRLDLRVCIPSAAAQAPAPAAVSGQVWLASRCGIPLVLAGDQCMCMCWPSFQTVPYLCALHDIHNSAPLMYRLLLQAAPTSARKTPSWRFSTRSTWARTCSSSTAF